MKFEALANNNKDLTEGKIYDGSIVAESEGKKGEVTTEIRIVVYNDAGKWRSYPPSYFEPSDCE